MSGGGGVPSDYFVSTQLQLWAWPSSVTIDDKDKLVYINDKIDF